MTDYVAIFFYYKIRINGKTTKCHKNMYYLAGAVIQTPRTYAHTDTRTHTHTLTFTHRHTQQHECTHIREDS